MSLAHTDIGAAQVIEPAAVKPLPIDKHNLLDYFLDLQRFQTAQPINPYEFEENWNNLPKVGFSSRDTARILVGAAQAIRQVKGINTKAELKSILLKGWSSWQESASSLISSMNAKDISDILMAHRMMDIRPDPEFLKPLMRRLDTISKTIRAKDFSIIFDCAAHTGFTVSPIVRNQFLGRLQNASAFLTNTKKTPLLMACAVLDSAYPESNYRAIAEKIKPHLPKNIRDVATQKQRYDSHLWFDWQLPNKNPTWQKSKISNGELKLADFIYDELRLPVNNTHAVVIPELPQAIDLTVYFRGGEVRIELDGYDHYVDEAGKAKRDFNTPYNGETKFRAALTQKVAPQERVLHISGLIKEIITAPPDAPQWSLNDRKRLMRAYLHATLKAPEGVHVAHLQREERSTRASIYPICKAA